MARRPISGKRLFVLDTNVLMHDPTALYRFQEHGIFLPMVVLEELDAGKKGVSEVARNARQASRFLDDLMCRADAEEIKQGLPLPCTLLQQEENPDKACGHLFFQTYAFPFLLPDSLPGNKPDNDILNAAMALQQEYPRLKVTLVSKDINLRIKATVLGIHAEDYFNDYVLDDIDLLFTGCRALPADFWDSHGKEMDAWQENGRTFYRVNGPEVENWQPNECLYLEGDSHFEAMVRSIDSNNGNNGNNGAMIEQVIDYRVSHHSVWGINARNREQNFALNLLMDPEIDFVSMLGAAGTGKTLLTLAAALSQTLDEKCFAEIIMTRVTVPLGEDIGFLPGTEEEKMTPWMGALMDNLEVLTHSDEAGEWGRAATQDLLQKRIKIRSLNFMRGRTFLNKFIIIDEAQNLTSKQMKALITRAGPGTKMVCLGNVAQIDTPYLSETTSGLTYVVDHFKAWAHGGHITLRRGERSRLADFATEVL